VTDALEPEDTKIITLARSQRARTGSAEGAAVRDGNGRTYAGSTVTLPSLTLSALQVAVALAVSGGATALEAAAVVGDDPRPTDADRAAVSDLGGPAVPILLAAPDGTVRDSTVAGA
jgi:hypothetical protein